VNLITSLETPCRRKYRVELSVVVNSDKSGSFNISFLTVSIRMVQIGGSGVPYMYSILGNWGNRWYNYWE
jgi:hypothetical protein